MTPSPLAIAVLISGSGSNLQALLDSRGHGIDYVISLVVSDQSDATGLERARQAGVATEVVSWSKFGSRSEFTEALCETAEASGADAIILAGFMRILSPIAMDHFPDAIINVHPALLPAFPGAHAVEAAIGHGVTLTGVTVHFVDEQVDHGPIILQEAVAVRPDDDAESLHARIQSVEHRVLPEVVSAFSRGELTVQGRYVRWNLTPREATIE
ncbi:MAG: phosphoribosylglycinamide formyltransferase [Actinomycetia bacterium]|nr:phosphoribosylglycinamide formyltransferase [Actinomycetes bacterium]